MTDSNLFDRQKDIADMLHSYMMAITEAGGDSRLFLKDIDTMTVKEMMQALATNRVRFCVKPKTLSFRGTINVNTEETW